MVLVFGLLRHRRSELEIICDVLELCLNGASKHKITYGAELNDTTLNKYLDILLSSGFVTVRIACSSKNTQALKFVYETTEAGIDFLEVSLNMLNRLGKVERSKVAAKPMEKTGYV